MATGSRRQARVWRQWHAVNGMLVIPPLALLAVALAVVGWRSGGPGWIALASLALLLAIVVQSAIGQGGLGAVHVPLGVAILGLIGALLGRTRSLLPPAPREQRR